MILNAELYQQLLAQAADNPRLRQSLDLRTGTEDGSQRMLNAMQPGTEIPIHRHRQTTETVVVLRGCLTEVFYDETGKETSRSTMGSGEGIQVPRGQFHTVIAQEPTVIFEAKDGAYTPLQPCDILS